MNYKLAPTDSDVLHYAKGSESKSHNYISRVFQKGRWVYTYAKNRARGNKVTNKNVKLAKEFKSDPFGRKLQYSPTIKTETIDNRWTDEKGHRSSVSKVLTEPLDTKDYLDGTVTWKHIAKVYGITDPGPDGTFDTKLNAGQNIGKEVVTNRTGLLSQYTPNYKEKTTTNQSKKATSQYSPTMSTRKHYDSNFNYDGDIHIDSKSGTSSYKPIGGTSLSKKKKK